MDVLSKPHVYMKDKDVVYKKIKSLVEGGFSSLQVLVILLCNVLSNVCA